MGRIPFGIPRLDSIIGGGAPTGSVVLLAGEAGAGARAFLYTSCLMNALGRADESQFDLHYGSLEGEAMVPESIHYLSFTSSPTEMQGELRDAMDADLVDTAVDQIDFADLSGPYFQLSPVPRSWYGGDRVSINELNNTEERRDVFEALGDYLDENASGSLVAIDALSDLTSVAGDYMDWSDIVMLVKGLQKAARTWDGVILLLVTKEGLTGTQLGTFVGSVDGTLVFEWERGGNELARTMVVQEFRGVLPEIEEENIVRFETEIHDSGMDVSDVRKIR